MKQAEILAAIEKSPARSAWGRGVRDYAYRLVEEVEDGDAFANTRLLRRALLNGAADWHQYSWGGCAYCYNGDICEALCTPSEQRRKHNGALPPNAHEDWLDVQARALYQAEMLIFETIENLKH